MKKILAAVALVAPLFVAGPAFAASGDEDRTITRELKAGDSRCENGGKVVLREKKSVEGDIGAASLTAESVRCNDVSGVKVAPLPKTGSDDLAVAALMASLGVIAVGGGAYVYRASKAGA